MDEWSTVLPDEYTEIEGVTLEVAQRQSNAARQAAYRARNADEIKRKNRERMQVKRAEEKKTQKKKDKCWKCGVIHRQKCPRVK